MAESGEEARPETHKHNRSDYGKTNLNGVRNFFEGVNWGELDQVEDVQGKFKVLQRGKRHMYQSMMKLKEGKRV